jgi:hypothetical protein
MTIETVGEAWQHGWRVTARCAHGKRDGMKSIRECIYKEELDLRTLVWTRGRAFPLSLLASRLRCPRCGSRDVALLFKVPAEPQSAKAKVTKYSPSAPADASRRRPIMMRNLALDLE